MYPNPPTPHLKPPPELLKGRGQGRGPPPGRKVRFCAFAFCSGVMGKKENGAPRWEVREKTAATILQSG